MRVSRIGFTPVKGGRHREQPYVDLKLAGPVGDRVFCLVDPVRGRVLRTVENPTLLQTSARWHEGVLTATLPRGRVSGVPLPTGEVLKVDYWGRVAALDVVEGPWAAAYSRHLDRHVLLARASHAGEVVYGASVSLVTSAALEALSRRMGAPVDEAVFRSTFTVDTPGADIFDDLTKDADSPRTVRLGAAEIEVRGGVPRCGVVDLDPRTGVRASRVLAMLAGYRRGHDGVTFGWDAVVTKPGRVQVGDAVRRVERG